MQASESLPRVAPPRRRTVIEPSVGRLSLRLGEAWAFRELLFFLVWRDVKVRYKQTLLGATWALLQPIAATLVFALVFGRFAKLPSDGVPYPVFVLSGMLAWTYFAQALALSGSSLVSNSALVTKVYFPRLLVPLGAIAVPFVDFLLALVVLGVLMAGYGIAPNWQVVLMPVFLLGGVLTAFGVGTLLSALTVRYRDVIFAVPFVIQLWLFATPVVYPLSLISGAWHTVFALNPMAGVIEGVRWSLLDRGAPSATTLAASGVAILVAVVTGLLYFRRVERHFADVI